MKNSTNSKNITVDLGPQSYGIHIGEGLLTDLQAYIPVSLKGRSVFVLTDDNVNKPHGGAVYEAVKRAGAFSTQMLAIPAGEGSKSFEQLQQLAAWLLDHGVNRQSVLLTVGGGVVGDLGGFVAAVTMRGIDFVQIPTSLLAQVDSSVGGKTGINVAQGKNLIGAFHQPISVLCDINALRTLPDRELRAGYAEIVKYALINDPLFFEWLEAQGKNVLALQPEAVSKAIEISCQKKAEIVAKDEKEKGQRALLNLGHTFGHAIEALGGYDGRLLHGEAIAVGMIMAFALSKAMGLSTQDDIDRVVVHFKGMQLPTSLHDIDPSINLTTEGMIELMKRDKKVSKGKMIFIVPHGVGRSEIHKDVDSAMVKSVIDQFII